MKEITTQKRNHLSIPVIRPLTENNQHLTTMESYSCLLEQQNKVQSNTQTLATHQIPGALSTEEGAIPQLPANLYWTGPLALTTNYKGARIIISSEKWILDSLV